MLVPNPVVASVQMQILLSGALLRRMNCSVLPPADQLQASQVVF